MRTTPSSSGNAVAHDDFNGGNDDDEEFEYATSVDQRNQKYKARMDGSSTKTVSKSFNFKEQQKYMKRAMEKEDRETAKEQQIK